jgi:hypothetical protein
MAGADIWELSSGQKWSGSTITYSFVSLFPSYYSDSDKTPVGDPGELTSDEKQNYDDSAFNKCSKPGTTARAKRPRRWRWGRTSEFSALSP